MLTKTGEPISSSRTLLDCVLVLDADRFCASFSFRHLKSENSAVDVICGEVEALRACRAYPGESAGPDDGYVADLGPPKRCIGTAYDSLHKSPNREKGSGLGGTGVRNLSRGLRVKVSELSELLRLLDSLGTSSTFNRWPGSRGHTVVDGSEGL